ncbi:uncharacterized protein VTP21DRAFT_7838 [Calcarisporiella thermophila]|uniref:uncharacterized protein n=1 Tax=Calcarisporiella thermophila TaxID=911321 RepID=UPI00374251FA
MYTYLFAIGIVVAIADAYGIGANDVANSFSTSVGSRSITLAQACIIAIFTEFLGAVLLGAGVAETIRGNIVSYADYKAEPGILMLGMVTSMIGSASWVITASNFGWPVSTTHSIVGAIIGFGIAARGADSVDWTWKGVGKIIASWFVSPVAAGIVAAIIFGLTQFFVLRHPNSLQRGLRAIPIYFSFAMAINIFYIVFKGAPNLKLDQQPLGAVLGITFGVAVFIGVFCWFFYAHWLRRRLVYNEQTRWYHAFVSPFIGPLPKVPEGQTVINYQQHRLEDEEQPSEMLEDKAVVDGKLAEELPAPATTEAPKRSFLDVALHGVRQNVVDHNSANLKDMHDAAIKYDDRTEYLYSFLQVITASFASFAHGSNDVANAVGPFATVYDIWSRNAIPDAKVPVPIWILVMGGAAIDLGLITFGYRVMRTLGNNLTYHSPSRGFSMELGTSLTVLTFSKLSLPVSTTHCITGATTAVGLMNGEGIRTLNWRMLLWCFFSWIITLPIAGGISGLLFAFVANSPTLASSTAQY